MSGPKPQHGGDGIWRRRILVTLALSGRRKLSPSRDAFFGASPRKAACHQLRVPDTEPGAARWDRRVGGRSLMGRGAIGTALPGIFIPAIRAGAVVAHCVAGIRGLKNLPTSLRGQRPSRPAPLFTPHARSACWPGVPSRCWCSRTNALSNSRSLSSAAFRMSSWERGRCCSM